MTACRFSL